MLQIGKMYEYEYMIQSPSGAKDVVHFEVNSLTNGCYGIKFDTGQTTEIQFGSPMAEFSEEIEHVA